MTSGKKNYFRHSFFARNDIKLRALRDRVGVGFYFYFFSLLEQCGEYSGDKKCDEYIFHDSIIKSLWGVNLKKSERVANDMMLVGLLFFEKREKTFVFRIDNFAKYLGRYDSNSLLIAPNKRKENKIKVNEIKINKKENDFADFNAPSYKNDPIPTSEKIRKLFLDVFKKEIEIGKIKLPPFFSQAAIGQMQQTNQFFKNLDDWKKLFQLSHESDFLMGRASNQKKNFNFTFSWIIIPENAQKVFEGKYANNRIGDSGIQEIMDEINCRSE